MDCVFCKIVNGEIPSTKVYEDDECLIFNNISPNARYHHLAILKQHFATLSEMNEQQAQALGRLLAKIPMLQKELHLENGFRLVVNQKGDLGNDANQEVPHLHIHILCGQKMDWKPA